jgi:hypothetical protein
MMFPPIQFLEADAVRSKTEAGLRPGGGAALDPGGMHHVPKAGNTAPFHHPPAIVARQTAITVPAPTGVGQLERPVT